VAQDAAEDAAGATGVKAPAARASLAGFIVRVVLWAALAFGAWHLAAKPLSLACGWIGARLVEAVAPVDRARAGYSDGQLVFSVEPDYVTTGRRALRTGTYYELTTSALVYSYGLPFFLALLFASRPRRLIVKALGGASAIVLVAGAAVGCDVLQNLTTLRTLAGESLFVFSPAEREAIALGYQLGALIFPALMPVILWLALDWRFVESLGARGKKVGFGPLQE
jgi:hypothetical protein